jgi:hypothetical protein
MGVSTNISLPTKISHAGFRTKTVDFIQLNPAPPPPVMKASNLTLLAKAVAHPRAAREDATGDRQRDQSNRALRPNSPRIGCSGWAGDFGAPPHAESRREMRADEKEGKQRPYIGPCGSAGKKVRAFWLVRIRATEIRSNRIGGDRSMVEQQRSGRGE